MPDTRTTPSILLVDDEPRILSGLSRQLRGQFEVHVAESGVEGLRILTANPGISVLVTDMRMPQMDGATLCSLARARFPDIVRIVLSGQSDFQASLKAVNEGQIFRFLTKPVGRDPLIEVLREAAQLYERRIEEKQILEETLHGAVDALGDVLALGNPEIFGRATRLRQMVAEFSAYCGVRDWWEIEVAAVFSQVGWVTVPPDVLTRHDAGEGLSHAENAMVARLHELPNRILERIPRLDNVRSTIRYCQKHYDGSGVPDGPGGDHIPWSSRLLHLITDMVQLENQGHSTQAATQILAQRIGRYDPSLLEQLASHVGATTSAESIREVSVHELRTGHRFVAPVYSKSGVLLVAQGQSVTDELLIRLENFSHGVGVREPLTIAAATRLKATGTEG